MLRRFPSLPRAIAPWAGAVGATGPDAEAMLRRFPSLPRAIAPWAGAVGATGPDAEAMLRRFPSPHRDSNPDCIDFKSTASASWAMGGEFFSS